MGEIRIEHGPYTGQSDTLVCVDGSYIIYHALYAAVNTWMKESPYSDILSEADVTDPSFERIDLVSYPDFLDSLKGELIEDLRKICGIVSEFNTTMGSSTFGDILFVLDPEHGSMSRSWRYKVYPEYKGHRKSSNERKPFDVYSAFSRGLEMLKGEDGMCRRFGMRTVLADGAEADDIIATMFMDSENGHFNKLLIASDKDYLQLKGVTQINIFGDHIEIEQPYPDLIKVTPETYLIAKIITGDTSDNITQVFNRVGYKTAVKKYLTDLDFLNESLESDPVAMEKFNRNTRLIDFGRIPKKIREAIRTAVARS